MLKCRGVLLLCVIALAGCGRALTTSGDIGHVCEDRGTIDAALGKDEGSRVAIKDCVRADGAAAQTSFEVLRRFRHGDAPFSLLRVQPHTGRKHQIRIHLAHHGHAIVGDKIYGGR